ncbi:Pentatricopeptide repeat-containing protein [Ananas comosus]|uniref:Pentatricopeptide repeat-containing protein n=1 Tax=Ananas comosus TaxID=4615 RepID=A0A199VXB2_ANACO|nr:Pentatricopeptide repeat-containing protein [Ananas comosus]
MAVELRRLFPSCATTLRRARALHALLLLSGRLVAYPSLTATLITLYSRLGDLPSSLLSFLHHRPSSSTTTIVSFNSLISAFVSHRRPSSALSAFHRLLSHPALRPDAFTFPVVLKACGDPQHGEKIHSLALKMGFCSNVYVGASLLHMYSRFGLLGRARIVFDEMPERDLGAWNALLSGFCQNSRAADAVGVFEEMVVERVGGDKVTFASVVPIIALLEDQLLGASMHVRAVKLGLDSYLFVSNALIDMYAKLGCLGEARRVFDEMLHKDLVSWNSLISGYEQFGNVSLALELFRLMKEGDCQPDVLTLVSLASATAQCGDDRGGRSVHCYIMRRGWEMDDIIAGNAIVDMYSKMAKIEAARNAFDRMPVKDIISWNTLITCYSQNGLASEAIEVFDYMEKFEGLKPIQGTLAGILPAYSHIGALRQGMRIHGRSIRIGLESDVFVATCLIDMYAKCGKLGDALLLFQKIPRKSSGPWNAIIAGHGVHGDGEEALEIFSLMEIEGVKPDHVTFISLLSACSHAGLVDQGQKYFQLMQTSYGIQPIMKHYACIVDLLGRAGRLNDAYEFIKTMRVKPDSGVWGALLGACRIHGNVEMGLLSSEKLFEIDPENVGYYVLLSNMYAKVGKWEGVNKVRSMVRHRNLQKTPGWSSIEVNKKVNVFFTGNQTDPHPQLEEIQREIENLLAKMKALGYVPDYSFVLQDVEEDEKEHILASHSERLAIAFGIISTSPETPIQIYKNLRVCGDCHNATKYISIITEREIIVRDSNRFHHFKEGRCSCGDYW